jgi:CheY-like chemotaxis protein
VLQTPPAPDAVLVDSDMPGTDGFALLGWLRAQANYAGPVILMLTFPHLKRKPEGGALGVSATLVKPFGFKELMKAITRACSAAGEAFAQPPSAPAASPAVRGGRSLRILVAEDMPFNQKFILRLLERWGHRTVLAQDGRQAVAEFSKGRFDIVLMDVQMPEMDGLEAAAAIRSLEAGSGGRTPIVAMTAYAVKGDRERCLAAGMDDYVSKPIDINMLRQIIEDRAGAAPGPAGAEPPTEPSSRAPELLKAFDNDWDFLTEVVQVFFSDYPRQLETLHRAADAGETAVFQRAAHSLKGMLRNFQLEAAAERAYELEKKGQTGDLAGSEPLIDALAQDLKQLEQELREVIKNRSA